MSAQTSGKCSPADRAGAGAGAVAGAGQRSLWPKIKPPKKAPVGGVWCCSWRCGGGDGAWLVLALALCRFFRPLKCHAASAANASRCPFKSEMCVRVDDAALQECVCVCGNIICSYWSRNANPPRNQQASNQQQQHSTRGPAGTKNSAMCRIYLSICFWSTFK